MENQDFPNPKITISAKDLAPIFLKEDIDKTKSKEPDLVLSEDTIVPFNNHPRSKKATNRYVLVGTLSHQVVGSPPSQQFIKCNRVLKTNEQPYIRMTRISEKGEKWQELETGWLKECSLIMLRNEEQSQIPEMPDGVSPLPNLVIEIGIIGEKLLNPMIPILQVSPASVIVFEPSPSLKYYIRCKTGSPKYTLVAYPI